MLQNKITLGIAAVLLLAIGAYAGFAFQKQRTNTNVSSQNEIATEEVKPADQEDQMAETNPQIHTNQPDSTAYTLDDGVTLTITPSLENGKISSPITIKGSASGTEPVSAKYTFRLIDPSGKTVSTSSVSVSTSGSGNSSSNFSSTLKFNTSASGDGSLEIDRQNNDTFKIPVEF